MKELSPALNELPLSPDDDLCQTPSHQLSLPHFLFCFVLVECPGRRVYLVKWEILPVMASYWSRYDVIFRWKGFCEAASLFDWWWMNVQKLPHVSWSIIHNQQVWKTNDQQESIAITEKYSGLNTLQCLWGQFSNGFSKFPPLQAWNGVPQRIPLLAVFYFLMETNCLKLPGDSKDEFECLYLVYMCWAGHWHPSQRVIAIGWR